MSGSILGCLRRGSALLVILLSTSCQNPMGGTKSQVDSGHSPGAPPVTLPAGVPSSSLSVLTASAMSTNADGTSTVTISVTLNDSQGSPISGDPVFLNSSRSFLDTITPIFVVTNTAGMASFTVRSSHSGTAVFSAVETITNTPVTQTANISFSAGGVSAAQSSLSASTTNLLADGFSTSTIAAKLYDVNGNPVPNKVVTLSSSRGGADTIAPPSATTDSSGVATFTIKSSTAGSAVISATDSTDSLVVSQTMSLTFAATTVSAIQSSVSASLSSITANGTSTSSILVFLKDSSGAPVSGKTVVLTSSRGASDTITPASAVTDSSGFASFSVKSVVAGSPTFSATDTTDSISISPSVAVVNFTPGPASSIAVNAGNNQTAVVHSIPTNALVVKVADVNGNAVSGTIVNWAVTSGGGSLTALTSTTDSNGLATNSGWTLGQAAGANALTATINGTATSVVFSSTGNPGPASQIVVSGFTSPANAGSSYSFSVSAKDSYNNIATSYSGTLVFSSSDALAVLPANSTLTSGTKSFTATLKSIGIQTITATDTVTNAITGSQNAISIVPASTPPTQLSLSGVDTNPVAGTCASFAVYTRDAQNVVTNATSTMTVNLSGADFGSFYSDACLTPTTSAQIQAGQASKVFYYKNLHSESGMIFRASDAAASLSAGTLTVGSTAWITQISMGARSNHTCVRLNSGAVWCFGGNAYGELTSSFTNVLSPIPIPVLNLGGLANSVTTAGLHTCALLVGGSVQCWGANSYGQLGNNTQVNSSVPVNVSGISTATAVVAGGSWIYNGVDPGFSCALLAGGAVQCWGYNGYGQLGNNTSINSAIPVNVSGINSATAIAGGSTHACALLSGGSVQCWGYNGSGQLGNSTTVSSLVPVNVSNISSATAISAGADHNCALLSSGSVQCWGYNGFGQLGNGTTSNSNVPTFVYGISSAIGIAAGDNYTCALLSGGSVQCWGSDSFGQLGVPGLTSAMTVPITVSGLSAGAIALGGQTTCAVGSSGTDLRCWGQSSSGQTGVGPVGTNVNIPTAVSFTVSPATQLLMLDGGMNYSTAPDMHQACSQLQVMGMNNLNGLSSLFSSDVTINLSTSGDPSLLFYSDVNCTNPQSTVLIPAGANLANVWFNDPYNGTVGGCGDAPAATLNAQAQGGVLAPAAPLNVYFSGGSCGDGGS